MFLEELPPSKEDGKPQLIPLDQVRRFNVRKKNLQSVASLPSRRVAPTAPVVTLPMYVFGLSVVRFVFPGEMREHPVLSEKLSL